MGWGSVALKLESGDGMRKCSSFLLTTHNVHSWLGLSLIYTSSFVHSLVFLLFLILLPLLISSSLTFSLSLPLNFFSHFLILILSLLHLKREEEPHQHFSPLCCFSCLILIPSLFSFHPLPFLPSILCHSFPPALSISYHKDGSKNRIKILPPETRKWIFFFLVSVCAPSRLEGMDDQVFMCSVQSSMILDLESILNGMSHSFHGDMEKENELREKTGMQREKERKKWERKRKKWREKVWRMLNEKKVEELNSFTSCLETSSY